MYLIEENVFLGSIFDATNVSLLKDNEISSILTIDTETLQGEIAENYEYEFIQLEDTESANLLDSLCVGVDFIEKANRKGKVLVHCHAGMSRSASFVCAWLMKRDNISLQQAEDHIKLRKPDIAINQGFILQLLIFESMGWKLDHNHSGYKAHKFRILRQLSESGHRQIPPQFVAANPTKLSSTTTDDYCIFRCKKCRKPLFQQCNVNPHDVDESKFFRPSVKNLTVLNQPHSMQCSSYFLEPIKWMEDSIIGHVNGKLECPHCNFKLGRFNWSGARCSCGMWITPSLQIHASNVDKSTQWR